MGIFPNYSLPLVNASIPRNGAPGAAELNRRIAAFTYKSNGRLRAEAPISYNRLLNA